MKIGELARRAGVTPRLVRYYEQQGLLAPERAANGYRDYDEDDVAHLQRVASLVRSGVTTRVIKMLLDCEAAPPEQSCPRALAEALAAELAGIEERIACLTKSRDTLRGFLARTEHATLVPAP